MSELRWNPMLGEWIITATHRQDRTYKPPAEFCPICPTAPGAFPTEIPVPDFDIAVFQNKFPSLRAQPGAPDVTGSALYPVREAQGECEVVVYTADHHASLANVSEQKMRTLVDVWVDRFEELGARDYVKYVFIFENRGEAVGVTLHHPHGQIYAYPFIPPTLVRELEQAKQYRQKQNRCLFCDILLEEQQDGRRIITADEHMVTFVPFFARFPYETHIYPRRHVGTIADLNCVERSALAHSIQSLVQRYDALFGQPMPYMMAMHQQPTDGGSYEHYHYHIEFLPLARTATKLKYLAGSESGAGAFITDMSAEQQAANLKEVSI
jgi:UDPglucose--hexose-1-phosphate uridylyltransferase